MIQDIAPSKINITYAQRTPSAEAVIMAFHEGALLARVEGEAISFPRHRELPCDAVYLFHIDETEYFLAHAVAEAPAGYEFLSLTDLRRIKGRGSAELCAAFTAYHLNAWYEANRFCGKCGGETVHSETERARVCPACNNTIYPRINPAVIVGVRNKDKLLITRYRTGYGHSALVAGFAEIGETLEDTVRREVMEEVGLRVTNITYYKSQPWGIAQDLLAGFYCDVDGDDTIRMDEGELRYAEWVARDDIELQPNDISLTNEMMKRFQLHESDG